MRDYKWEVGIYFVDKQVKEAFTMYGIHSRRNLKWIRNDTVRMEIVNGWPTLLSWMEKRHGDAILPHKGIG